MNAVTQQLVPGMRQSLEEVMVDTANLLAEVVQDELRQGELGQGHFAAQIDTYLQRARETDKHLTNKHDSPLSIYVTDAHGIVIYDSARQNLGADFSQWNDVYLTLRGKYGARTTRSNPADPGTSVMYVAAPIRYQGSIIGVLTVAKPSTSIQPYFESALRLIKGQVLLLYLAALGFLMLVSYWLTLSIRKLTRYAEAVRQGRRVAPPRLRESELAHLTGAMEEMRIALEGKDYVENYLHSMTHEMKSPLAAIRGAVELLQEDMVEADRQRFIKNIANESARLQQVVEQLLMLASVEKRRQLQDVEEVDCGRMIKQLCEDKAAICRARSIQFIHEELAPINLHAEAFLLRQAISNLLDNALDFSPEDGHIEISSGTDEGNCWFEIHDQGPGIPDYALPRIFERFYSLPRPHNGNKSSGLGLSLVREVVELHGGRVYVTNRPSGGTTFRLSLPLRQDV
jgi:two-component system sensor histidine kinase CreC